MESCQTYTKFDHLLEVAGRACLVGLADLVVLDTEAQRSGQLRGRSQRKGTHFTKRGSKGADRLEDVIEVELADVANVLDAKLKLSVKGRDPSSTRVLRNNGKELVVINELDRGSGQGHGERITAALSRTDVVEEEDCLDGARLSLNDLVGQ